MGGAPREVDGCSPDVQPAVGRGIRWWERVGVSSVDAAERSIWATGRVGCRSSHRSSHRSGHSALVVSNGIHRVEGVEGVVAGMQRQRITDRGQLIDQGLGNKRRLSKAGIR